MIAPATTEVASAIDAADDGDAAAMLDAMLAAEAEPLDPSDAASTVPFEEAEVPVGNLCIHGDDCLAHDVLCVCGHIGCLHSPHSMACEAVDCECEQFTGSGEAPPVKPEDMIGIVEDNVAPSVEETLIARVPESRTPIIVKGMAMPAGVTMDLSGEVMIPTEVDPTRVTLDVALTRVFNDAGVERLGGASGDLGWSSFSAYQRCPYLWKRNYIDDARSDTLPGAAIETGSAVHAFLAVHYMRMMNPNYKLDPEKLRDGLLQHNVMVEAIMKAWMLFEHYTIQHENDVFEPLAVEYHIQDPETRESARFDLIARVKESTTGIPKGALIVEHKTAGRFDRATLEGWHNDGEILGQIMLWKRLRLDKKFGKLSGVMVNILGKQKVPQFARVIVPPQAWQLKEHAVDLKIWYAQRQLSVALNTFPRARANCINRYGMCSQWEHCTDRGEDQR